MKKKFLIGSIALAAILLSAVLYFLLRPSGKQYARLPDMDFENWDAPIPNKDVLTEEAYGLFDEEVSLSYEELINRSRDGRVSLISELWRLRRQCPSEMDYNECNVRIRLYLSEKFPPPGNEKLLELFRKYLRYEQIMTEFRMPDHLTDSQRYELIQKKRREIFGEEDSKLVFGFEEAKVNYVAAYDQFMKSTASMSGAQRIAAYEQMRKKSYGDYYNTIVQTEPPFTKYETELTLRDNDLKSAAATQRTEMTRQLREKYFGKEGADRMAQVDQELAQEARKEEEYRKAEQQYLSQNPNVPQADRDRALAEMRQRILGEEAAEAYARQEAYRKAMEQIK